VPGFPAFVLGAGLGTRLRPLTDDRPKPLVPVFGKPLITFAFDHLIAAGATSLLVNTHHRAEAYDTLLGTVHGRGEYGGHPLMLRHEPVLLDTGGGIANIADLVPSWPLLVHNGDVLADLDLHGLIRTHLESGADATLGLRRAGGPLQVGFDPAGGRVLGIRGEPAREAPLQCLFTGIYAVSPGLLDYLDASRPNPLVPALIRMIADGRAVGGFLMDAGTWWDLGTPDAYLDAHGALAGGHRLSYLPGSWPPRAECPHATLSGFNAIGDGAQIGEGASLEDCVVWPGAKTASRVRLRRCIVHKFAGRSADGEIL